MTEGIPRIDSSQLSEQLRGGSKPFHGQYYAMYSSIFGAIVTDPAIMLVPIDDHVVHRGDGVFETLKCVNGNLYNLPAHLARLAASAARLGLALPVTEERLTRIIIETVRAGGQRDCLIRALISRGPGSLGVNPYDCPEPGLYVVVAKLNPPFMQEHPAGATAKSSSIPIKASFFATIKSCNYLPNVLMKKEAVDAGVDFVIAFDENNHLAEGATENVAIATHDGRLCVPRTDRILSGTTMKRVVALANAMSANGTFAGVDCRDITRRELEEAAELLIVGTTPDVTAVVSFEGKAVGNGKPGPLFGVLSQALKQDILHNTELQTPVFQ